MEKNREKFSEGLNDKGTLLKAASTLLAIKPKKTFCLPCGLTPTNEGQAWLPVMEESFGNLQRALKKMGDSRLTQVLTVDTIGTYAVGWLRARLRDFQRACPSVDLQQELDRGAYWLDRLQSRTGTGTMTAFWDWLKTRADAGTGTGTGTGTIAENIE